MKLVAPKLSYIEKTSFEECLKKMKFQDVHIDQNIQQRTIIQDLTFDGCLFENIDFTKVSLKYLDLIDVTFDKCDLSNQNFDHQYLNRVQFKNCKLTGTSFIETNLKDVLFDHCQGRYSNLSSSQLLNVMFGMKCLVRPVIMNLYGFLLVNFTVSPIMYLHNPQEVEIIIA